MSDVSSGKTREILLTIGEILNLVMALKSAYTDIFRRAKARRPVSRRVAQLRSNLLATLQADKSAADNESEFEVAPINHRAAQLPLL